MARAALCNSLKRAVNWRSAIGMLPADSMHGKIITG
jgi:hypothetical protein